MATGNQEHARDALVRAVLGVLLGLGVTLKSTFALLAVLVTISLVLVLRRRASLLKPLAVLVTGAVLALAPFAARNVVVGVPPLAMAGSGTLTFVASNDISYPKTGGFLTNPAQLAEVLGATGGHPIPATLETLRRLSDPTLSANQLRSALIRTRFIIQTR